MPQRNKESVAPGAVVGVCCGDMFLMGKQSVVMNVLLKGKQYL